MEKIIVSGIGYERSTYEEAIEGQNLAECYRKLYVDIMGYWDEEDLGDTEDIWEDDENWDNPQFWFDKIRDMDTADFVLLSVYSTSSNRYLYKRAN